MHFAIFFTTSLLVTVGLLVGFLGYIVALLVPEKAIQLLKYIVIGISCVVAVCALFLSVGEEAMHLGVFFGGILSMAILGYPFIKKLL